MFKKMFSPDSGLMITMTQITDCIFLSLFWLLGCVPVVTVGASSAALYDSVYRGLRKGEKNSWQRFLKTFRSSWKSAIVPTVIYLVLFFCLGSAVIRLWNNAVWGNISWMLFAGGALVGAALLGILSILFPLFSRFENSTAALLKNTVLLGMANLPLALLLGIINAAAILLCLRFVFPVFLLPGVAALLGSFCLEPMFRPYMPAEEETET